MARISKVVYTCNCGNTHTTHVDGIEKNIKSISIAPRLCICGNTMSRKIHTVDGGSYDVTC